MAIAQQLSHVYPLGSRLNEGGCLEVGGCDALELAREFGTPAYVVAEDDLRSRARTFAAALGGRGAASRAVFASKAFPCTAVLSLFAQEGLGCDVASEGELHLALRAGFAAERIVFHGNARSEAELRAAVEARVGLIVLDNDQDVDALARIGARSRVLLRITPDVRGETHEKISTGQADSKFGFSPRAALLALERIGDSLEVAGLHMHIGSQLLDIGPLRDGIRALAELGRFPVYDLGGGLGVAYTADQQPPSIADYVEHMCEAADELLASPAQLILEPGRALVANGCVTLYTVQSVKQNVSTWVGVDGGMSDNLRPMLYGSRYEAEIVDRFAEPGSGTRCHVAGKHCESGDVIVRDALLADPRPGDVLVTPATGAYGYAMASNYNGVPRPPVIFCSGGDARLVVRRERLADLHARDVH
ncbi:MAG: diaminopimelate decarboxylase [Solirubrobacteraceae bacterium]